MADETDHDAAESPVAQAGQRIRDTAKWLVVTFGAVGAAIITGLQLTGLSDLTGSDLDDAEFGFGLAMAGVVLAIVAAAWVLAANRIVLSQLEGEGKRFGLRRKLNERVDLRAGFGSVANLVTATNDAITRRTQTWQDYQQDKNDPSKKTAYEQARERAARLVPMANRLTDAASYEHLRRVFVGASLAIVVGVAAASVGVVIFAEKVAQPEPDSEPAVKQDPVAATIALSPRGAKLHRTELGPECQLDKVRAMVLSADAKSVDAVTVPTKESPCRSVRLALGPAQATVQAVGTLDVTTLNEK